MTTKAKNILLPAGAFALSVVVFLVLSAWNEIAIFGGTAFLSEDLNYQYVDFFQWFRRVLLGETSLFYTSSQALGSNSWGMVGYYLSSPFNLLVVLFEPNQLPYFCWTIAGLKAGCMGATMAWYLRRRFDLDLTWCLTLATCYSWCTWTATQLRNLMWMDAFILLPLALLGLYYFLKDGRWKLLLASVTASVIICWYSAYMTILFVSLMAIVELIGISSTQKITKAITARKVGLFIGLMIAALALSAFTFVPSVLSMMGSENNSSLSGRIFAGPYAEVVTGFLFGCWEDARTPQFYGGMVLLIAALAMPLCKRIPFRTKAASLVLLVFLFLSGFVMALQIIWCGFRIPSGFYCRTAIFVIVVLIWMAAHTLVQLGATQAASEPTEKATLRLFGIPALIAVAIALVAWAMDLKDGQTSKLLINLALIVLSAGALFAYAKMRQGRSKRALSIGILVLVSVELLVNAHLCWTDLYGYSQFRYSDYRDDGIAQLDELRAVDDGVYRIAKTYNRWNLATLNEGTALDYMELNSYTSAHDSNAIALFSDVGYNLPGEYTLRYIEPILPTDSLFGVKYASLSDDGTPGFSDIGMTKLQEGGTSGHYPHRLFKNDTALPLGFGVSSSAIGFAFEKGTLEDGTLDPFRNQNDLFSALLGRTVSLYTPTEATLVSSDDKQKTWTIAADKDALCYAYLVSPHDKELILNDDDIIRQGWHFGQNIFAINAAEDGSRTILMHKGQDLVPMERTLYDLTEGDTVIAYTLDMEELKRATDELGNDALQFDHFADGSISGTFTASRDDEALLLTIPNADGWTATVNGEKVEIQGICNDALMAIPVSKGENTISLSYQTPGLIPGTAVSVFAALAIIGACVIRRKRA